MGSRIARAINLICFAMPLALFEEMEANVEGSFLEQYIWKTLMNG